jgi:prophage tail gpP-like protein
MGAETVSVSAGGSAYVSWKRVEVRAAMNEAARSFSLECVHEGGPGVTRWTFGAGKKVAIALSGSPVLEGYVDRYNPRLGARERSALIEGRSKSADFVDSSAEHPTGEWRNRTVIDIADELDKFGIGVRSDEKLERIPVARLVPGETAFAAVERLCRSQGLTLCGQADGGILITRGGRQRHAGALIEGRNILQADADHNWSNRYSRYVVRGQRPDGHGPSALEIERAANDPSVDRHRPLIIVMEEDIDDSRADRRAKNRRDRQSGASLRCNVTVQGFRDEGGTVWEPGRLVYVESPSLAVHQDMLLESVTWTQSERDGSLSALTLVDPKAYGAKASKGGKSGAGWQSGAGAEQ